MDLYSENFSGASVYETLALGQSLTWDLVLNN